MRFSMLVEQHLGADRFVVTNSCRQDIPLGTQFTVLGAARGEILNGVYIVKETELPEKIALRVTAIEFWRKPWQCVPNGHHAGVVFDGDGVGKLVAYLARHEKPWHVTVETAQSAIDPLGELGG
jgi:hypothetical protein